MGRDAPLRRWIGRELDPDGVPRRLPVADWVHCLRELASARRLRGEGWPEFLDARIEGLVRQTFRFSRPDGSPVLCAQPPSAGTEAILRYWAEELSEPGLATVVDWWFPSSARRHAPPPLPAHSCPDRPLAMLRANWLPGGDLLAIDHRAGGSSSRVELRGQGRAWLGPGWTSTIEGEPTGTPRPVRWVSNSSADLVEWSFRIGDARVVRTALLLRGRKIALLADQTEGVTGSVGIRITLPRGIAAVPVPGSPALAIARAPGRPSAQAIPLALPSNRDANDRGEFRTDGGELFLRQNLEGRQTWLPILVSWEPSRHRKGVRWRTLTVSERSKVTPRGVAVAYLAAWGRDEMLVVYRSLARPATRTFLGHQTSARFLIGLFTREGEVQPLLKVTE